MIETSEANTFLLLKTVRMNLESLVQDIPDI